MIPYRRSLKRGGEGRSDAARRSPWQERSNAKSLGGRITSGSGNGPFEKGDVRVSGILRLESKATSRGGIRVTREMVDKIETAAIASGELPAIDIEFLSPDGTVAIHVAVIPFWALESLVGAVSSKKRKK